MKRSTIAALAVGVALAIMCLACGTGTVTTNTKGSSAGSSSTGHTASGKTETAAKPARRGDEIDAYVMSQKFVKRHLNYPHDASFPWGPTSTTYLDDLDAWRVAATVKAKNALGGTLTYEWVAIVYTDDDVNWQCHAVTIDRKLAYVSEVYKSKCAAIVEEAKKKAEQAAAKLAAEEKAKADAEAKAELEARVESRRRTWTDTSGEFTIEAALLSKTPTTVTLQKEDGTSIQVPIEKLSEVDRDYLKSLAK